MRATGKKTTAHLPSSLSKVPSKKFLSVFLAERFTPSSPANQTRRPGLRSPLSSLIAPASFTTSNQTVLVSLANAACHCAKSLRGELVAWKLGFALQQSVPMPQHNKPDAENDIDDHAPRNVPLWNGDKARIDAVVMGEIPQTMRQECRRDEPGTDPHAEQGATMNSRETLNSICCWKLSPRITAKPK